MVISLVGVNILLYQQTSDTILAHSNDTILVVDDVDAFWYSSITVTQCTQKGDDYHDFNIYVIKGGAKVVKQASAVQSEQFHIKSPTLEKQKYLYLLNGSTFKYRMCLASTTNYEQMAVYNLFDDRDMYFNYVDNKDNDPIFHKTFKAGKNNLTICTEVSYNITKPSYYFMVVNAPANIIYSYNFTLNKVEYDINGSHLSCNTTLNCEISLNGAVFDVIAYVKPSDYAQSTDSHLCVELSKNIAIHILVSFIILLIYFLVLFVLHIITGSNILYCFVHYSAHPYVPLSSTLW